MRILLCGTFDHLHLGHEFMFHEALKRSDDVWVIVARDANVERIKGRAPDESETYRVEMIQSRFPSLHVLLGDEQDFLKPVKAIAPDLFFFGYDQQLPPQVTEQDLECKTERLPAFEPHLHKSSLKRTKK